MRVLVLTTEPITAAQLREALPSGDDQEDAEVMVVAPALHTSALRFWMSDADTAIDRAEAVRRDTLQRLGEEGVSATADTGEGDPADAIEDALKTFPAERIVIFAHSGEDQLYREDVDARELESRLGVPVTRVEVAAT